MILSLALWLWLRMRIGVASLKAPKLVKFRLGGPKLRGLGEVPAMPSSVATSAPLAKNGVVSLRLRLNVTCALLTTRAEMLRVHPTLVFRPEPVMESRNP